MPSTAPTSQTKKAALHFVGGYEEPLPSINYVWCSLFDNHPTDVLGEAAFYYNQVVMLSSDPKVQLYGDNSEMVKEVGANADGGKRAMGAESRFREDAVDIRKKDTPLSFPTEH